MNFEKPSEEDSKKEEQQEKELELEQSGPETSQESQEESFGECNELEDFRKILTRVEEDKIDFEKNLQNISPEIRNEASAIIEGKKGNEEIREKICKLLKRDNFNLKEFLNSGKNEQKVNDLLEEILITQSYDKAVEENQDSQINFRGFENDEEFSDANEFICRMFGTELLQKCLISEFKYIPDKVFFQTTGDEDFWVSSEVYKSMSEEQLSEIVKHKYRATSFIPLIKDRDSCKKIIPTPIYVCSFINEKLEDLDYLDQVPEEEKMRLYKLGTISHEIGHHIYGYLMDAGMKTKWKELIDKTKDITRYSGIYKNGKEKYAEPFAESIRLKTTVPRYFKENFPEIDNFINNLFPEIKTEAFNKENNHLK